MSGKGESPEKDICGPNGPCNTVDVILTDEETHVVKLLSNRGVQICKHSHNESLTSANCSDVISRSETEVRVKEDFKCTFCTQNCARSLISAGNTNKKEKLISISCRNKFVCTCKSGKVVGLQISQNKTMSSSEGDAVISSASAIMARHQKKKKWYRKLGSKVKSGFSQSLSTSDKKTSKSAENLCIASSIATTVGSLGGAHSMIDLHRKLSSNSSLPSLNQDDSDDGWADTESNCSADVISADSGILLNYGTKRKDDDDITEHDSVSQILDVSSSSKISTENLLGPSTNRNSDGSTCGGSIESDVSIDSDNVAFNKAEIVTKRRRNRKKLDTNLTQRRHDLLQHAFFHLDVWLKEGRDLVVRDSGGTSDPYVKFKIGSKSLYKSRTVFKNLNPRWDEKFTIPVEDVYKTLVVKCYDYDRGRSDDPMGEAEIDMSTLELSTATELKLPLQSGKTSSPAEDYMGYILLQCTLTPKTAQEKELFQSRGSTLRKTGGGMESSKKLKMQIWSGVVTIVLVEGSDLMAMDDNGFSDPYVKFKLGPEKYKSKFKTKTLNPRWLEQFDLRIFDDHSNTLDITVYDHDISRDDFMGRATIDLKEIEKEKTHVIEKKLEDGAGTIKLLLTISGTQGDTVSDLANFTSNPKSVEDLYRKYGIVNSFKGIRDVGWLQVKVFRAQGLMAADIGGKSDPFCVLELVNARLQTQTEYKTLNPEWNKVFTFNIKDIHSVLEVTVYDEDRDKKVEFLGKIAIPLLQIRPRERRWYGLKDKKLMGRSKGAILLELDFIYNHFKAAIRTVNPREEKYMQPEPKFKISVMKRNIERVSQLVSSVMEVGRFLQSCWAWESKPRSISAFCAFLVSTWFFEPYMLPVTLLILFLKNYITNSITDAFSTEQKLEHMYEEEEDDEDEDDDREKDDKKSVREKFQAAQQICLKVQEAMDMVASMGERVKNTFNWSVPWLSTLAVIVLSAGALILYYIPIRYLVLAWGINKFTKKLRAPNAIPNNELIDFLSRVPSDSEKVNYKYLRPDVPELKKKQA